MVFVYIRHRSFSASVVGPTIISSDAHVMNIRAALRLYIPFALATILAGLSIRLKECVICAVAHALLRFCVPEGLSLINLLARGTNIVGIRHRGILWTCGYALGILALVAFEILHS